MACFFQIALYAKARSERRLTCKQVYVFISAILHTTSYQIQDVLEIEIIMFLKWILES